MLIQQVLRRLTQVITSEDDMLALGARLGRHSGRVGTIFLRGDLGAGKTTFVRGLLRGKGYGGTVKSPTYSLAVSYHLDTSVCYHLDLYRLQTGGDSDFPGLRDLLSEPALTLIEWPECVSGWLLPDVGIQICYGVHVRHVTLQAHTEIGNNLLCGLSV